MARAVVVGGGVIGLTSAVELLDAGFEVRVISRDSSSQTVSAVAGAAWAPFHVAPKHRTDPWAEVSLTKFLALSADTPEAGVRLRKGTLRVIDIGDEDQWWWKLPGTVELEWSGCRAFSFERPIIDMSFYLPWLEEQIVGRGGLLERRTVDSFDQVTDADIVVNCTGLGARELVGDNNVFPLRGQIVVLERGDIETFSVFSDGPGGLAHVFPRINTVVIGGTVDESDDLRIDDNTTREILERCTAIEPRLASCKVIGARVGLRPTRHEVRLAVDHSLGAIPVVHNYGHGGGGVTLSWGCAAEVRDLCKTLSSLDEGI